MNKLAVYLKKYFINPSQKIAIFLWEKGDMGFIDYFSLGSVERIWPYLEKKSQKLKAGNFHHSILGMGIGMIVGLGILFLAKEDKVKISQNKGDPYKKLENGKMSFMNTHPKSLKFNDSRLKVGEHR